MFICFLFEKVLWYVWVYNRLRLWLFGHNRNRNRNRGTQLFLF
jgi:hypothetical protein